MDLELTELLGTGKVDWMGRIIGVPLHMSHEEESLWWEHSSRGKGTVGSYQGMEKSFRSRQVVQYEFVFLVWFFGLRGSVIWAKEKARTWIETWSTN